MIKGFTLSDAVTGFIGQVSALKPLMSAQKCGSVSERIYTYLEDTVLGTFEN